MTSPGSAPSMPWGRLLLLAAAVGAAVTTEVLPVGLLPQLSEAFGVDAARIGWWMSAYAVVVALGAIPVTAYLTRFPRRAALLVVLLTYAVSNAVIVAADGHFWVALAARAVGGLAHAGLFSVVVATAVELTPPRLAGRAVAITNAGGTLALAFGVPLGTAAGTALGWRWSFTGTTLLLLALALATRLLLPAPGRELREQTEDAAQPAPASVLLALRSRALLLVAVTTVVLMVGHYSAYTYVSPILRDAGVGADSVALVLLGFGAGSLVGLVAAGVLADRHAVATLRVAVLVLVGCLVALALLADSAVGSAATVVVWGAAFGGLPTLLQTVALRVSTPDAAPAVVNATFNVGIATGAWVGGQVLIASGPATLTVASAAVVLAGWGLLLRQGGRRGRRA